MDKEALIKNRFWIVLGGVGVLALLAWVTLLFAGSSDDPQKKYVSALKEVENNSKTTPKNEQYVKPWEKFGKEYADQKNGVWEQAWKGQETIFSWDKAWDSTARFNEIKYYDQDVGPDSEPARKHYAADLYARQFKGLNERVAPVEFRGGLEGFKELMVPASAGAGAGGGPGMGRRPGMGGGSDLRPPGFSGPGVTGGGGGGGSGGANIDTFWAKDAVPTMEEIWYAQEDFWVKSAMLDIIHEALDKHARFQPVDVKDEPLPEKIVERRRFRNPSWEITLLIEEGMVNGRQTAFISPRSTIKNVNASQRTQQVANSRTGKGLSFRIEQNGAHYNFVIEGEPLPYNASVEIKKPIQFDNLKLKEPFTLTQVLEWATSPIRRIDDLKTAKNSHRLANKPLKPNTKLYDAAAEAAKAGPDKPADPGGRGGPPVGPSLTGSGPGGGGSGPTGAGGASGTPATPAGLERDRYLLTNDICRHLPIGMVLVVDQAAVNDVLIAVANSPLRIQVTQVHLLHVHDSGPAEVSDTDQPGPGGPGGPGSPSGPGRGGAGAKGPRGPGAVGPLGPGSGGPLGPGGAGGSTADASPEDDNLFELTVYGVATLYERYPAREQPKEGSGTPPKPPGR